MPKFSKSSKEKLLSCDSQLIRLFSEVIKHYDCKVICGYRGEREQNYCYKTGVSKVEYPNSRHNVLPSLAVDVIPYPIDWKNIDRFIHFAGFVKGVASQLEIDIFWGGEWKMKDMPHYQLISFNF